MQLKKIRSWKVAVAFVVVSLLVISCDKVPLGPTEPDPLPPPPPGTYMSFTDFRALYTGTDMTVPAGTKKIRGVVISNSTNEAAGNYRLQDESGSGVYFYSVAGSPVYSMGSVLEINAAGAGQLILYNGDLELKSVPQAKVVPLAGTLTVTPRVATVAQIITNKNLWASSLVKINSLTSITTASVNGTGTNYNVKDATGTITLFVRAASGITVNPTATSITGYISIYNNSAELGIRTAADLQ
jgi:hypothetical protein